VTKLDHKESPVEKRILLFLLVAFIALSQIFVGWVLLYRLEDPSDDENVSVTDEVVEATPYLDPDISLAQDIVARLQDEDPSNDNIIDSFSRNNFLKILVSQMGSNGEIIGGGMSSYDYYTEWYIGGYDGNTGWNANTPWCASFISWCIGQINLSVNGQAPRYANVDLFRNSFGTDSWLTPDHSPTAGDLVFFGYNNDPNHMGVVLATDEDAIYTIEGNTANVVGIRKYSVADERIIGYGVIDWRQ